MTRSPRIQRNLKHVRTLPGEIWTKWSEPPSRLSHSKHYQKYLSSDALKEDVVRIGHTVNPQNDRVYHLGNQEERRRGKTPTRIAGVWFSPAFVCVPVCLFIRTMSQKTNACTYIMFHDQSWNTHLCLFKKSNVKVTSHKNIACVGLCTLVSAGFFSFADCVNRLREFDRLHVCVVQREG